MHQNGGVFQVIVLLTPAGKSPHRRAHSQHTKWWLNLVLISAARIKTTLGNHGVLSCMLGSLHWVPSLHSCGSQVVTASSCPLGSLGLEISPLKKSSTPLSAPQRPIATHRTTATPKSGPGMVRKNPGVGNGDDEAAELMQQVGASCVQDGSHFGGKDPWQH